VTEDVETEAVPRPGEFAIETVRVEGGSVVSVRGELDIASSPAFKQALEGARATDACTVLVDLAGLQFIDSTGLRVLLAAKQRAAAGGGDLRIRNARAGVRRLLEIAGVLELLSAERD
jgi:anti-sigma B factor antagonist